MKKRKYHLDIFSVSDFTKRIMELTKELGHSNMKCSAKDLYVYKVGVPQRGLLNLQCMLALMLLLWLKPIRLICKDTIKNITKYWPGGYYLTLKRKYMVPRDRSLLSSVCKYNYFKFLSLIDTDNSGSTQFGIPFFYNYSYQFLMFTLW